MTPKHFEEAGTRRGGGGVGGVESARRNSARVRAPAAREPAELASYFFARAAATAFSNASPRKSLPMIFPSPSRRYVAGMLFTPYFAASLFFHFCPSKNCGQVILDR